MKFLVLALCVCAASAASYGAYKPWQGQQVAKAVAQTVYKPAVVVEEAVVNSPVVAPVFKAASVAKTVYNDKESAAAIVRYDNDVAADGFNNYYETANGIAAQSTGTLKKVGNEDVLVIQGSYQYVAPDGTPVTFSYIADENGYQPKSDFLPVAPPVPEAIARSLEYLRTHAPKSDKY